MDDHLSVLFPEKDFKVYTVSNLRPEQVLDQIASDGRVILSSEQIVRRILQSVPADRFDVPSSSFTSGRFCSRDLIAIDYRNPRNMRVKVFDFNSLLSRLKDFQKRKSFWIMSENDFDNLPSRFKFDEQNSGFNYRNLESVKISDSGLFPPNPLLRTLIPDSDLISILDSFVFANAPDSERINPIYEPIPSRDLGVAFAFGDSIDILANCRDITLHFVQLDNCLSEKPERKFYSGRYAGWKYEVSLAGSSFCFSPLTNVSNGLRFVGASEESLLELNAFSPNRETITYYNPKSLVERIRNSLRSSPV